MKYVVESLAMAPAATPLSLTDELRVLARIAVDAYVQDVVELVRSAFESEASAIDSDETNPGRIWLQTRKSELAKWQDQDYPLDWGDSQATYQRLTRILSAARQDIPNGLPKSARGSTTDLDFVARLYKCGTSHGPRGVKSPMWWRSSSLPVMRTAIAEAHIALSHGGRAVDCAQEFQQALRHAVIHAKVRFFPDASSPTSREPSVHSWTFLGQGESARRILDPAQALTQEERIDIELAQHSQTAMDQDVYAPWCTADVEIYRYAKYMDRACMPTDYDPRLCDNDAKDPNVKAGYAWAEKWFREHPEDWRSRLARHLAFLITKLLPHIFWDKDALPPLQEKMKMLSSAEKCRKASIDFARSLAWIERPGTKGVNTPGLYYTQAAMVFLNWIHEESHLRRHLTPSNRAAFSKWHSKHCKFMSRFAIPSVLSRSCPAAHKALTTVNLYRMGLLEACTARGFASAQCHIDYVPRKKDVLEAWEATVSRSLRTLPDGSYQLCTRIFGTEATTRLIERHQFGTQRASALATAVRVAEANGHSRSRGRAREDDDEEDSRPAQRRRKN